MDPMNVLSLDEEAASWDVEEPQSRENHQDGPVTVSTSQACTHNEPVTSKQRYKSMVNTHENLVRDDIQDNQSLDEHMSDQDEQEYKDDIGEKYMTNDDSNHVAPYVGLEFITHEDAYMFYNSYAEKTWFGTRKSNVNRSRDGTIISRKYVCSKEGHKDLHDKREKGKQVIRKRDTRTDCMAKMYIRLTESGLWVVKAFENNHNHPFFTPSKVKKIRSHNKFHMSSSCKNLIQDFHDQGLRPTTMAKVINVLSGSQEITITPKQCVDRVKVQRRNNIGRECIAIVKHFQEIQESDPSFYFAMELSDDQTLRSVFWADGRSRESYLQFGDVVCFDVTYKTNKFSLPFAPFTGVNHHRQSILFGCALLADETEETFVWLFEKWLKCMFDIPPGAIVTDQDPAMRNAIKRVFPSTRHRFCSWHINLHALERTRDLQSRHSDFWVDYKKWCKSSSKQKFEERWVCLKDKYQIDNKHWLSRMYEARDHWISSYLNDTFFAGMTTSQRSESINYFFDGFVHSNTPLYEFIQQYHNAIESRRDAENSEDYLTMNSSATLCTSLELEKQAGECYTRKIFNIFQEQLKGGISCWHKKVSKDGNTSTYIVGPSTEDQKKWKRVVYDVSDGVTTTCHCAMFETEGILCMHILRIMNLKGVPTIPQQYILKRWTMSSRHHLSTADSERTKKSTNPIDITPLMLWDLKLRNNKMIEVASSSIEVYHEFMAFLENSLAKVELQKKEEQVAEIKSHVDSSAHFSRVQIGDQISEITIRDPTSAVKHKGRPPNATRLKSSVEVSEAQRKQRTCSFCKAKGHYRTGCSKAKEFELGTSSH